MINFLQNDSIISPLGFGTEENIVALRSGTSGLQKHYNKRFFPEGFYAGLINTAKIDEHFSDFDDPAKFTKLEKLIMLAIGEVLQTSRLESLQQTALVISTTKGNIDQLGRNEFSKDRIELGKMAQIISDFFEFPHNPIIVSNACISGGLAIKVADDLIKSGKFKNAIVAAGDLVSDFVLSGFQSFQAISPEPCKPFSNDRQGVSLGEGASAILLSSEETENSIKFLGAATANDANHISGPSRTAEGLFSAIEKVIQKAKIDRFELDLISAHGTATLYNDEMESIAFSRSRLQEIPLNSLKGYYGHSLGNSALLETIITKYSLLNNELFTSLNFSGQGTSKALNIISKNKKSAINLALKTASGFGGCNLAMILKNC